MSRSLRQGKRTRTALEFLGASAVYLLPVLGLTLLVVFFAAPERHWWAIPVGTLMVVPALVWTVSRRQVFEALYIAMFVVVFAVPTAVVLLFGRGPVVWAVLAVFAVLCCIAWFRIASRFAEAPDDVEEGPGQVQPMGFPDSSGDQPDSWSGF
ncbi:hypothetical protein GCM10009830_01070 [Glycomyces endophyticus]|uniref:Uncharacterized protein n=1 Tax=Glycomyces endophyticus TaxID=480996 RepID=A0ABN2FVL7_9ACTN